MVLKSKRKGSIEGGICRISLNNKSYVPRVFEDNGKKGEKRNKNEDDENAKLKYNYHPLVDERANARQ